ncbi:uncharacterized protein LOC130828799 [Amaranthus tricolor]|uniref:uncharacterized protein LOC130828799 n=1 Tax=Amaranthus tricolor TaxID=29722 RepID=UPI0025835C27|nr:uncharacterized protein LOC130828799 [Amaranthus tricolor]
MASACMNNIPTTTTTTTTTSHSKLALFTPPNNAPPSDQDPDFEFQRSANPTMITADQLHFFPNYNKISDNNYPPNSPALVNEEAYLFSPKAPLCFGRWRDYFLGPGFRKLCQPKTTSSSDSSFSCRLPLLKDSSSSSSSYSISSHDQLPRLSVDSNRRSFSSNCPKINGSRMENPRSPTRKETLVGVGVGVDSPRMNPSGKVAFQSLERSSSSPGSFNGGSKSKYKLQHRSGIMERSYSANVHVRITPVLNVPVCSLRGSRFGHLFSSSLASVSQPHRNKQGNTNTNNGTKNKKKKEKK